MASGFTEEKNDYTVMELINILKSGENLKFEYTPSTIRSSKSIYSFSQQIYSLNNVLHPGETLGNKMDMLPALIIDSLTGETVNKQENKKINTTINSSHCYL